MTGKELIISNILGAAEQSAAGVAEDIAERAREAEAKLDAEMAEYSARALADARQNADDLVKHRLTLAGLESRKAVLAAKQRVIDHAFRLAAQQIAEGKDYPKFIATLLQKHAEDGDTVVIRERDKGVITEALIRDAAAKSGIKLTLSKTYGAFSGGVILSNQNYDKNLTLDTMLGDVRADVMPQLSELLFHGK